MAHAQPRHLRALRTANGECVMLRSIGPADANVLQAYVRGLSPQSRHNRFFGALHELPPTELDRVIHFDRKCELALLAEIHVNGKPTVVAEARYVFLPDRLEGEFAFSVADDWRGRGLGSLLIADLECRARSDGAHRLCGDVLHSNEPMKALVRKTGFLMVDVPHDATLVRITKDLVHSPALRPCESLTGSSELAAAA